MSDETDTLQDLLRQAHETIKDLRGLLREAAAFRAALPKLVEEAVGDQLKEAAVRETAAYFAGIDKSIDDATEAVYQRFDRLYASLVGELDKRADELRRTGADEQSAAVRKILQDRGFTS
jgi:hypothetical protein